MVGNRLYYGDNLDILRRYIDDESIDLIYLDPPFNSNADYNVLFAEKSGEKAHSQIKAFEDTWEWGLEAAQEYAEVLRSGHDRVAKALKGMHDFLGGNDMLAYLSMMALRLIELRRVLKPTGSIYLHCDPTASHYLKIIMDAVFGPENFRNEISWRRSNPKSLGSINFANCRDILLRYGKSQHVVFNRVFGDHDPEYVAKAYRHNDEHGRYRLLPLLNPNDNRPNLTYEFLGVTRVWRWTRQRMEAAYREGKVVQLKPGAVPQYKLYLNDSKGRTISNDWADLPPIGSAEQLGYPTQKPLPLLERVLAASSNPGEIVLDPFCGCGTAIAAAQKLGRRWIGVDITHLAITLIKSRLLDSFGPEIVKQYRVIGEPVDLASAWKLAEDDKFQFQVWALGLVGARPLEVKKGADRGIDGRLFFNDSADAGDIKEALISVKGGQVTVNQVRDLRGVIEREGAAIGAFLCIEPPTKPMLKEAADAGFYASPAGTQHPRLQVLTIEEMLAGKQFDMPPWRELRTFKAAARERNKAKQEEGLF